MSEKPVFLTQDGLSKLTAELEHLRAVRRPQVAARIHQAKEFSDTVDNAEYDDAKNEQAFVEGRILTVEKMLRNAVIINDDHAPTEVVQIGSKVKVRTSDGDEEEYTIVGSAEADPKAGRISNESPVGRSLLGRHQGEEIQVMVPAGLLRITVMDIK